MSLKKIILVSFLACTCLHTASAGRSDRGIVSLDGGRTPFMYKGAWMIGGSASGSSYGLYGYGFSVLYGSAGEGYGISFRPGVLHAFADDLAIGVTGLYTRSLVHLESAGVSAGQISLDVEDLYSLGHNYGVAFVLRKFLPLGNEGRFSLYSDAELQLAGGQSKLRNDESGEMKGTYETSFRTALCVNPGIAMYVTPHMALTAGVGMAGIGYARTNQVHNQVATGSGSSFHASYILNLMSLSFGVHYCF